MESEVLNLVEAPPSPRDILIDFSAIADVDYTGGSVLHELYRRLRAQRIQLGLVQLDTHVTHQLTRYRFLELLGEENIYEDMESALIKFRLKEMQENQEESDSLENRLKFFI
jgi:anti-anti-sigma regulatory factor